MRPDKPIVQSLLDDDFYKFSMGQYIYLKHPSVRMKSGFACRTKALQLAKRLDMGRLREEFDAARQLRVTKGELHYVGGTYEYGDPMFRQSYLDFLGKLQLPEYDLRERNGELEAEFGGRWCESTYWEMHALSIISELFYEQEMAGLTRFGRKLVLAEGHRRLAEKIRLLRRHPGITFSDFGTRRRFSRAWQREVIQIMSEELPDQFRGTSNVEAARDFELMPIGTSAHEIFMVAAGLAWGDDDAVIESQRQVLRDWWGLYDWGLSVALPDTFGSPAFYDMIMTPEQANGWKGVRQDSGVPERFFDRTLEFYRRVRVDPKSKIFIPSDGLTAPRMVEIHKYVGGRMVCSFGWGTDLMNDLGFKPISIVVKAIEANGQPLVKLSDNLAKAIGKPEDIAAAKRIFGYDTNEYAECVY